MTHSPARIDELLAAHGLAPQRSRGQNFVADPNTVRRIARLANVGPGDKVVEIGPGVGSLTLALTELGADVVAVEVDEPLVAVLAEVVPDARVVLGDALTVDWPDVLGNEPHVLVANLPYNVATTLILELLDSVPLIDRMLVMVQKEVAERLVAVAGSKTYGIPSVKVAYWGSAHIVGDVPPTVFIPKPRVDSALVEIARWPDGPAVAGDPAHIFMLVKQAFGMRRKMVRKSLGSLVGSEAFVAADIDPQSRPEQLSVHDWGRLSAATVGE